MISITWSFEERPGHVGGKFRGDIATASRADLLWYYFAGNVCLLQNGIEFNAQFGWVPLLHFGASLIDICKSFEAQDSIARTYVFTESTESIRFERRDLHLDITCTFAPGVIRCELDELCRAVKVFCLDVTAGIELQFPRFLENPFANEFVAQANLL